MVERSPFNPQTLPRRDLGESNKTQCKEGVPFPSPISSVFARVSLVGHLKRQKTWGASGSAIVLKELKKPTEAATSCPVVPGFTEAATSCTVVPGFLRRV